MVLSEKDKQIIALQRQGIEETGTAFGMFTEEWRRAQAAIHDATSGRSMQTAQPPSADSPYQGTQQPTSARGYRPTQSNYSPERPPSQYPDAPYRAPAGVQPGSQPSRVHPSSRHSNYPEQSPPSQFSRAPYGAPAFPGTGSQPQSGDYRLPPSNSSQQAGWPLPPSQRSYGLGTHAAPSDRLPTVPTAASPREPSAGGSGTSGYQSVNFSRRDLQPQPPSEQRTTGFSGPYPPLQSARAQGSYPEGQQRGPAPSNARPPRIDTQSSGRCPQSPVSALTTQERQSRVTRSPVSAFPPDGSYNSAQGGQPPYGNSGGSNNSPFQRHR